jgi:DNA-binding transcriptional MerR regulator
MQTGREKRNFRKYLRILPFMSQCNMNPSPAHREETYSIGDLAREFDVTPRAIRFYEDQGLLAPQRLGSRRIYAKRDYVRLKLILRGKRLGLSLSEVAAMFDLYDSARDEKPQLEQFLAALAERREQLERQRADIDEMLGEIAAFEAQSRKILAGGKTGRKLRITD